MIARKLKEKPEISTFHALCVRILRQHGKHIGLPSHFTIFDEEDKVLEAVKAYATLGEISDVFRKVWGQYREGGSF